jgi:hypothetical protein
MQNNLAVYSAFLHLIKSTKITAGTVTLGPKIPYYRRASHACMLNLLSSFHFIAVPLLSAQVLLACSFKELCSTAGPDFQHENSV